MKYILSTRTCRFDFRQMLCFFHCFWQPQQNCLPSIYSPVKKNLQMKFSRKLPQTPQFKPPFASHGLFVTTSNHNCNKIISSKWLAAALSSALMGQCDRTVWSFQCKIAQCMYRPSPHTFFTLSKKPWGYLNCVCLIHKIRKILLQL